MTLAERLVESARLLDTVRNLNRACIEHDAAAVLVRSAATDLCTRCDHSSRAHGDVVTYDAGPCERTGCGCGGWR